MDLSILLLILFGVSVPVFYIIGLISAVLHIFGKDTNDSAGPSRDTYITYLKTAISDLTQAVKTTPNKTLRQQLEDYKKRLKQASIIAYEELEDNSEETVQPSFVQTARKQTRDNDVIANWYSNNSINLLLYIGAFLIVMSASIFVGFQWETIPGMIKAGLLTILTAGFFISGLKFYTITKIKNAGYTFIGIGALLIPICGTAWYNFVLKDQGISAGSVWLITSIISLSVYLFLASRFRSLFYMYIASASTLSISLSLVNTFNLNSRFYILASITTSFILLLSNFLVKPEDEETKRYVKIPLDVSSHVLMPISLAYGLITALGQGALFSFEAALSVFLASGFYLMSYYMSPRVWKLAVAESLIPIGMLLFSNWQHTEDTIILYGLTLCGFLYLYLAYFIKQKYKTYVQEENVTLSIGFITLLSVFLYSWVTKGAAQTALFSFALVVAGMFIAAIKNRIVYTIISTVFLGYAVYSMYQSIPQFSNHIENLTVPFLILGVISYSIAGYMKKTSEWAPTFGISAMIYFVTSLAFAIPSVPMLLTTGLTIMLISGMAAIEFDEPNFIYASNSFMYFSLIQVLRQYHFDFYYYPLSFIGLSYVIYTASLFIRRYAMYYRISALSAAVGTPIVFGLTSFGYDNSSLVEKNALLSAYATTALFGIDTFLKKTKYFGYITSAMAMTTYIWQIGYIGITETLMYTAPLGIYFIILSYIRRIKDDNDGMHVLTLIGCFFLLAPPFALSFGDTGTTYTIILGAMGIGLLSMGITLNDKYYKNAGIVGIILAVIPQTWNYLLSLPRWVLVGGVGAVFILVAIYLMLRRKENP